MAGVTFAQLPDEVPAFLAWLLQTGDVWARPVREPFQSAYAPLPVIEAFEQYGAKTVQYSEIAFYLGFKADVLQPRLTTYEVTEGGIEVPFVQDGKIVPGAHSIVGGTKVQRIGIHGTGSALIRYSCGQFRAADELSQSTLGYSPGTYVEKKWVSNPKEFLNWGKKVLAWMRRQTPDQVPVYRCNYSIRATARFAEAHRSGLKVR